MNKKDVEFPNKSTIRKERFHFARKLNGWIMSILAMFSVRGDIPKSPVRKPDLPHHGLVVPEDASSNAVDLWETLVIPTLYAVAPEKAIALGLVPDDPWEFIKSTQESQLNTTLDYLQEEKEKKRQRRLQELGSKKHLVYMGSGNKPPELENWQNLEQLLNTLEKLGAVVTQKLPSDLQGFIQLRPEFFEHEEPQVLGGVPRLHYVDMDE